MYGFRCEVSGFSVKEGFSVQCSGQRECQCSGFRFQVSAQPLVAESSQSDQIRNFYLVVGAVLNRDQFGLKFAANRGCPVRDRDASTRTIHSHTP